MATASFGNLGYSGLVKRQRSRERIMPKSQQVSKIRQILSNRGAGVDTLDLVDDWVDPTVGYEDNKREILRRVGFSMGSRITARQMAEAQCSSAISSCRTLSKESSCEVACEECKDKESCDELKEIKESGGLGWEARLRIELAQEAKAKKYVLEKKKKVVKPTQTTKPPKATKKAKVTTKLKKPKPTPIAKSKLHEKILTDAQIQHARKHGYVNVTIEGVKKRVSKKNFAARKRTIYWYLSKGKVSLKVVRR